jgi:PKD repeat protein
VLGDLVAGARGALDELEDVGEDFQVEYTSVEGYGRMDKVQIYKGTTRSVNVTFTMIATNPEDHATMWYKINKLAMVIYPQWTQGRKIEIGNLKFIQPFSQIPGATPVIRLRLGDLWKSNYSKMSVARLFGATTLEDYNVESNSQTTSPNARGASAAGNNSNTNPTPTGAPANPTTGTIPLTVYFTGSGNDPDGNITSYHWDFGDGNVQDSGFNAAHVYETPGAYTAKLIVTDVSGATASTSININVRTRNGITYYVDSAIGSDSPDLKLGTVVGVTKDEIIVMLSDGNFWKGPKHQLTLMESDETDGC